MLLGRWLTEAVQQGDCGLPTPSEGDNCFRAKRFLGIPGSYSHHRALPGFLCAQQRAPAPRLSAFPGSRSPLTAETASRHVSVTLRCFFILDAQPAVDAAPC